MTNSTLYRTIAKISAILLIIGFILYGNQELFNLTYIFLYIFIVLRAVSIHAKKRMKFLMFVAYTTILWIQLNFSAVIALNTIEFGVRALFSRAFSTASAAFPFLIERTFIVNQYASFYLPSVQEISTFTFNEITHTKGRILSAIKELRKLGSRVSPEKLEQIITDLPRHNSFRYVNNGSLTEEYFNAAYETLSDPHIYIVISNTGSPASELISVFTRKQYNHTSLSFDSDLKTIISYNGGERVYPPGLNHEMIDYFNKKEDSSIIVYRLGATAEQKSAIIEKIRKINTEGSAYNILGLLFRYSYKTNIMFCSQFVYKMLKCANLQYFEKRDGNVKPTDFIELDYRRRLEFAYEIMLNRIET